MFTALVESWDSWLPALGGTVLLGGYLLLALFLFTLSEALGKVRPEYRRMRPGLVWLNLIPGFNLLWIVVTVLRLADSVAADLRDRKPGYRGDGGKTLGLLYAATAVLTAIPPLAVLTGLPCLVFTLVYWSKVVRLSKELDAGTGEGVFWQKYNQRLEFPNSMALATLLITTMFALVVGTWALASAGGDKKPVPITLVDDSGMDDDGMGSPGSGGVEAPLALGIAPTVKDVEALALPKELPQIQDDLQKQIELDDPTATAPVPEQKAAGYATLNDDLQKKLLNLGQRKGTGPGPGSGPTGQAGSGPGGTGADSTRARSLRWVLLFRTTSGRDYLNQLQAMRAVVVVPLGADKASAYVFYPKDLDHPRPDKLVTEPEWKALANQIQFCDFKRDSAKAVGEALGLNFTPVSFWAFFPAELEKELARKEIAYRNRRPEDVAETKFEVQVRGGQYELVVVDQKTK